MIASSGTFFRQAFSMAFFFAACIHASAAVMLPSAGGVEFKVDMIQLPSWAVPNPDQASKQRYQGIVVDLLAEFEKRSGHKIIGKLTPYRRVESDLEEGKCDFSLMAWGEARSRYANRGTEFFPLEFGVRARKGIVLKAYSDLKKLKISVTRGLKVDPTFDDDTTLDKIGDLDYETGVKRAAVQNLDAVAGSLITINKSIRHLGFEEKFGDTLMIRTTHMTVSFSKKSPNIAMEAKVNAIFKSMVTDGTARKIHDKWLN